MNNRVFWGAIALAVAAMFAAATVGDAARRMPNRDGELIAGHDGSDQQMVYVDSDGNVSVEFGANATAFTVGGPAADDAAASGNPVQIGCKHNTTTNAVEDGDISYVNCGTLGDIYVSGRVASGATDSGNPVKVGGLAGSSAPSAVTAGQRANMWLGLTGNVSMGVLANGGADGVANSAVGTATSLTNGTGLLLWTVPNIFNGSSWDRNRSVINATDSTGTGIAAAGILAQGDDTAPTAITENQFGNLRLDKTNRSLLIGQYNETTAEAVRGNTDITVLASAARTGTTASADLTNYNGTGLHLQIEVTAITDTPSVVCTIQGKASVSAAYYTILTTAAIVGVSSNNYRVFPGSVVTANVSANDIIPRVWRVNCVHADADSITYSVSASVVG